MTAAKTLGGRLMAMMPPATAKPSGLQMVAAKHLFCFGCGSKSLVTISRRMYCCPLALPELLQGPAYAADAIAAAAVAEGFACKNICGLPAACHPQAVLRKPVSAQGGHERCAACGDEVVVHGHHVVQQARQPCSGPRLRAGQLRSRHAQPHRVRQAAAQRHDI